jgi:hypothetical protein
MPKKLLFFFSYDVILEHIFVSKKKMSHRTKKCKYTQERIEMILVFMKFVVLLNILNPYDWNKFMNHVKSLIIIISQIDVFQGDDRKYVIN